MGARFAVATANGRTALYLALRAHGIGPGDEVITSPLTFIASANAIVHAGALPVFADVDASLNLDPDAAAAKIGGRTKAIMPVHLHGNPANMQAFQELAERHGLVVIQDACQAVGATIEGKPLGRFGTAAYSFYATKNLTTGEGGMVITNDPAVARTCASLRHQAYAATPYLHESVAYNFRMTEIQAAIGLVQLRKLPLLTERRRATAAYYDATIHGNGFVRPAVAAGHGHVYHQYTLRMRASASTPRDAVRDALERAGIGTGVYYPVPVHRQPPYRESHAGSYPESERASADMFSIPVHPGVSDQDRARIVAVLNAI